MRLLLSTSPTTNNLGIIVLPHVVVLPPSDGRGKTEAFVMKAEGLSFPKFKYNTSHVNKFFPHLIFAFEIIGQGVRREENKR